MWGHIPMKKSITFFVLLTMSSFLCAHSLEKKIQRPIRLDELVAQSKVIGVAKYIGTTEGKRNFRGTYDLRYTIREFKMLESFLENIKQDERFVLAEAKDIKKTSVYPSYRINFKKGHTYIIFSDAPKDFSYKNTNEEMVTNKRINLLDSRATIHVQDSPEGVQEIERSNKLFNLSVTSFKELKEIIKVLISQKVR